MGETILSNSSFLSDSKDDCEILVHFLSSNLGMLGSCQSHVFYTLEKEIQTKSQQRMKKTLPSCGFSENSLHLCTTQVSSHSYPFHPLQTQNWGRWREHLQCCSVHSELKVIWETLKMHFYLLLRQTKSQRHEGLALNQSQSWAAGLLIPVPKSSLLKGFGAHKPSLEFKCSLKKIKLRSVPLHSDTAAKPQARDVHEAATNEGYAGNVTSFVHSSKKRHSSFLLKQNSNFKKQNLIVKYQMLPRAMSILSPVALDFLDSCPNVAALARPRCF